jgi:hypothetical protein
MLLCDDARLSALDGTGLIAGYYYDPYPPRFDANLRKLLSTGARVLVRLHAGVRYPMDESDRIQRLDREGHVVAVVGFDGDRLLIADPWDTETFGGAEGGLRSVDHRDLGLRFVNGTKDKAILAFPLDVKLTCEGTGDSSCILRADVALRAPSPQIRLGATMLRDVSAAVTLPAGAWTDTHRRELGAISAGDSATATWEIGHDAVVEGEIAVAVAGIARGTDPYPFEDVVGSQATVMVRTTTALDRAGIEATAH